MYITDRDLGITLGIIEYPDGTPCGARDRITKRHDNHSVFASFARVGDEEGCKVLQLQDEEQVDLITSTRVNVTPKRWTFLHCICISSSQQEGGQQVQNMQVQKGSDTCVFGQ